MRTVLTVIFSVLIIHAIFACGGITQMTIRSESQRPIAVWIDGYQAGYISREVYIDNLTPGRHEIRIYEVSRHRQRAHWNEPNYRLVYRGQFYARPETAIIASLNSWAGTLQFTERPLLDELYVEDEFFPRPKPFYPDQTCGPRVISNADFAQLKTTISQASFESTRMSILKSAMRGNYFYTAQVRQLLNLFIFESSKLEASKMLYDNVLDRHNYYQLNNAFNFSSSVDELNNYLAQR